MCGKIIVLAIILASVGAQFASDRRFDGNRNRNNHRTSSGGFEPELNQEYESYENARTNLGQRKRNSGNTNGNGRNFGRLRTNLDSSSIVNYQPTVEDNPYAVKGLGQDQGVQFDVHSSHGRGVATQASFDSEDRRQFQSYDAQPREERPTVNNNQKKNLNGQTNSRQEGQNVDFSRQNGRKKQNSQGNRNTNDNIRNNNQYDYKIEQNIESNSQNVARNNQNNSQQGNRNENNRPSQNNTNQSIIDSRSRAIADKVAANRHDMTSEDMDREINNQISKMLYEEGTEPKVNSTKSTKDNELPSRSSSGGKKKEDDMWVWGDSGGVQTTTVSPSTPSVDDRAAFSANKCPTDHAWVNEQCVMKDKD